jgi:hypothetical protein
MEPADEDLPHTAGGRLAEGIGVARDRPDGDAADAEIQRRQHEEKLRRGISDPYAKHRDRPLLEHAQDYYDYLRATGTSQKHATTVLMRIKRMVQEGAITFIRDLTVGKVKTIVAKMTRQPQKRSVPKEEWTLLSAQSRNFYLAAMKQFLKWMQIDRRIPDKLLLGLKGENVAVDRRHDRRALTDLELSKLFIPPRTHPSRWKA